MASKRRERRKGCGGKQRHATQSDAIAHLQSLWRRTGHRMTTYQCRWCKGWHVAHRFPGRV